jgi:opacity protein-like surface antigen
MNRTTALLTLILLAALGLPATLNAQVTGVRAGIGAGPAFPLGDLGDEATTGFHIRGSLGLDLSRIPVGARADVLWQRFPDEHEGHFSALGGLLNATLRLPMPAARPYLIGGIGVIRHQEPDTDHGDHAHEGDTETGFAFGLGGGLEIRILGLGGFLEARYVDWGNGHSSFPLTLGLTF